MCSYLQMSRGQSNLLLRIEKTCGSLLYELQIIWDEVGESDAERDRILLELEQECLEVYKRKVDQANRCRAELRQAIADAEAELAVICSAMGEQPAHIRQSDQSPGSLKDELGAILPQIEEMRKIKNERRNQFLEVLEEIQSIRNEIYSPEGFASNKSAVDESDLSVRRLEELHSELKALQKEKSERLGLVLNRLNGLYSLCIVLGLNFEKTVTHIHPSLAKPEGSTDISDGTIKQLDTAVYKLRELKIQRMQQLQDLAASLLELWNLMDTPIEEQQMFQKVTCNLVSSEDEMTEPNMLSVDYISHVKAEVSRLEELKASKMKELVLKKKAELEDICRRTHIIPDTNGEMEIVIDAIESGAVDADYVLGQIELQIGRVKEEALSRKEILEKMEKWVAACEEESWLEEYNRDDNRYNAGRGGHLALKRAEKARILVNKLPAMVDALALKTIALENEKGTEFSYDGVRLLSMLQGYVVTRQEKELQQKKQREQKKLQVQLLAEQEALYGSKPSPMKQKNVKKGSRLSCGGDSNRRLSLGAPFLQTPKRDTPSSRKATPNTVNAKKNGRFNRDHFKDDGSAAAPSTGRRRSDMTGLKQNSIISVNGRERHSPLVRKPFSPISSTKSSKPNAANTLEEHNEKIRKILNLAVTNNTPFRTPPKMRVCIAEQENRTPQTKVINLCSTPSTISVPMQTAITPASTTKTVEEEIEYSFEERRAGFVLPRYI